MADQEVFLGKEECESLGRICSWGKNLHCEQTGLCKFCQSKATGRNEILQTLVSRVLSFVWMLFLCFVWELNNACLLNKPKGSITYLKLSPPLSLSLVCF